MAFRNAYQWSLYFDVSMRARWPICMVIPAQVDGLVLSSAPDGHSFNYPLSSSAWSIFRVEDRNVKCDVMRAVTNHIVAGRWEDLNPVASFQVSLVFVIRVEAKHGCLKLRTGIPRIQPRDRAKDGPDREEPLWTGVVPLCEHLGQPVPSGLTNEANLSESLVKYIQERNERHESYAKSVTK
ncbi:hypothetical protein PAAG_01564 [Paracoccidioides lutzii Pb01]|uniref:Uncharacterized protein n=1 Tax=Paracoccidioides lutzii (strain ATCC MYA-826 / Pb01) TaxID=502779 RepID=C1GSR9_PARBA|nr:hypothetical protein PAAG_01564 [Paracoccidioides lutzii Pb01]EEH39102.1 hypothetical protein PAAG_01564 [Paracoccidioides lutzii Pb01]